MELFPLPENEPFLVPLEEAPDPANDFELIYDLRDQSEEWLKPRYNHESPRNRHRIFR
jgi:hypothetical protein